MSGKAVSPKFGVMDWKLRYPSCFEILVCVGCRSQTVKAYLQNIEEKGDGGVCSGGVCMWGGVGWQ